MFAWQRFSPHTVHENVLAQLTVSLFCTREAHFSTDLVVSGLLVMVVARIGLSGQPEVEGRCHHVGEVKDEG